MARRARDFGPRVYDLAEEAIAKSLVLAPGNFEARKLRTWVLLGKHEFQQALDLGSFR